MHPFLGFKSVIGLGWAGLVITKIFWEKLVAVKWSWWGRCTCSWLGRKYSVFLATQNAFYGHFTCENKQYYTRKYTVPIALSMRKMPWYRTAEALSGKKYALIFGFKCVIDWAGLGWWLPKDETPPGKPSRVRRQGVAKWHHPHIFQCVYALSHNGRHAAYALLNASGMSLETHNGACYLCKLFNKTNHAMIHHISPLYPHSK